MNDYNYQFSRGVRDGRTQGYADGYADGYAAGRADLEHDLAQTEDDLETIYTLTDAGRAALREQPNPPHLDRIAIDLVLRLLARALEDGYLQGYGDGLAEAKCDQDDEEEAAEDGDEIPF